MQVLRSVIAKVALAPLLMTALIAGFASTTRAADIPATGFTPVVSNPAQAINPTEPDPDVVQLSPDLSARMTVEVTIGGKGPYFFIVDSGAERTILTHELAQELDLRPGKTVQIHGFDGVRIAESALVPNMQLSQVSAQRLETPLLERQNLGASGIVGIDVLQSQRVLIDFKAETMAVTPSPRDKEDFEGESVIVRARKMLGQLVLVDASVGDVPINVIVDTGAQISVGNEALRRLLQRSKIAVSLDRFSLRSVTGDLTDVSGTIVKGVRIGGLNINNLPVAFTEAHLFQKLGLRREPSLLLGMDALKLFDRVSIDFAKKRVRFAKVG